MVTPTFKILNSIPCYHRLPDSTLGPIPKLKSLLTRVFVVLLCCSLAYSIPNLGQFLNFQGSITGILMTFVLPISVYFKAYGDRISKKERMLCNAILIFGITGGIVSASYAFEALIRSN
jgi:Transmembrane amino acid transporter protein